jgi:hypothetical protein
MRFEHGAGGTPSSSTDTHLEAGAVADGAGGVDAAGNGGGPTSICNGSNALTFASSVTRIHRG